MTGRKFQSPFRDPGDGGGEGGGDEGGRGIESYSGHQQESNIERDGSTDFYILYIYFPPLAVTSSFFRHARSLGILRVDFPNKKMEQNWRIFLVGSM